MYEYGHNNVNEAQLEIICNLNMLLYFIQSEYLNFKVLVENNQFDVLSMILSLQNKIFDKIIICTSSNYLDNSNAHMLKYLLCSITDDVFLRINNENVLKLWRENSLEKSVFKSFVSSSIILQQIKKIKNRDVNYQISILYVFFITINNYFSLCVSDNEKKEIKEIITNVLKQSFHLDVNVSSLIHPSNQIIYKKKQNFKSFLLKILLYSIISVVFLYYLLKIFLCFLLIKQIKN